MDSDEELDIPTVQRLLRTLGARPSRSAEEARARQLAEIDAMSVEERMIRALRLGKRDRALRRPDAGGRGEGR